MGATMISRAWRGATLAFKNSAVVAVSPRALPCSRAASACFGVRRAQEQRISLMIMRSVFATVLVLAAAGVPCGGPSMAATLTYDASLSGANVSPPTASTGTGSAQIIIDTVSGFATVNVSFSGLVSTDTNAHVNCCTASPGTTGAAFILT